MQQPPNDQPNWQQPQYEGQPPQYQPSYPQQPSQPNWPPQQSGQLPPQYPQQGYPQYTQYPQQPPTGSGTPPPQWQQPYPFQQPGMPPQYPMPPQQPPKKRRGPLFWVLIALASIIVLSVAICAISLASASRAVNTAINNVSATITVDTGNSTTTTSGTHYKVKQTANIASMDVTVNSTRTSSGDQYSVPKAGNQYLIVDVTVLNKSGQSQDVSSALSFTLKDDTGQKYTETVVTMSGITPPDGTVQNGAKLRGQIVYDVPKSMKTFTFDFQPSITSTDVATWDISLK